MLAETSKASFSYRRPVLAVVIIELLLLLAVMAAGAYATIRKLDYTAPVLLSFVPIALVLVIYFTWRSKWGDYGFRSLRSIPGKEWIYYLPLAVILIVLATQGFQAMTPQSVLYFLFFTLLVGFVEETVYLRLDFEYFIEKGCCYGCCDFERFVCDHPRRERIVGTKRRRYGDSNRLCLVNRVIARVVDGETSEYYPIDPVSFFT